MANVLDERLDLLVLARLQAVTKRPPSRSEVSKSLQRFAARDLTDAEWRAALDAALSRLRAAGHVQPDRCVLTERGVEAAERFTGIGPDRAGPWSSLVRSRVVARALELHPSDEVSRRIKQADGLRAAVLARHHGLEHPERITLTRAVDGLVWRELGIETNEPLSLNRIRAHVLSKALGGAPIRDLDRIKRQLAAQAVKARRADADALRVSLIAGWLCGDGARSNEDAEIELFALRVQEAARSPDIARMGRRKAFISSVWEHLRRDAPNEVAPLDVFKTRLVEANQKGLLRLARADLVAAMDPALVAASETSYLNATFHFVETSEDRA